MMESGINYYVHGDDDAVECNIHCMKFMKDKIEFALKLQELVKKRINNQLDDGQFEVNLIMEFQSLVEESEK